MKALANDAGRPLSYAKTTDHVYVTQRYALEYNSKLTLECFWIAKMRSWNFLVSIKKITFSTISEKTYLLFPAKAFNSLQK